MPTAREIVRKALRRYRRLSLSHRRGGMHKDYELALEALEALERLVEVKQLKLGDQGE